jgi:hypothetical protein
MISLGKHKGIFEDNIKIYIKYTSWKLVEKVAAPVKKTELTAGVIRCADHATPSIRKSWH